MFQKTSIVFLIAILFIQCGHEIREEKKTMQFSDAFYDSISFRLCKLYSSDQGIRSKDLFNSTNNDLLRKIDSSNFSELVEILKLIGVPKREKLGECNFSNECVEGAFGAVLLHNPHELLQDSSKMNFFIELVNKGDLKPEALATILDKYYWSKSGGKRVMYGSQFGKPCAVDSLITNRLRSKIGLIPLKPMEFKHCEE